MNMGKIVLVVTDYEGDYGALHFAEENTPIDVVRQLFWDGTTSDWWYVYGGGEEYAIEVTLHYFGDIDSKFVELIKREIMDYDDSKRQNFYVFDEEEVKQIG
jgi:hypothetical protein